MKRTKKTTTKAKIYTDDSKYQVMNKETGEVVQTNAILETVEDGSDANFHKIWLFHILDAIDEVTTAKFTVMMYLIENMNKDNQIIATQKKIAQKCEVSLKTVGKTIRLLKEADFLTMPQRGVYRINPDHIWQGYHPNRMAVLRIYEEEKQPPVEGQTNIEEHIKTKEQTQTQ